MLETKKRVTKKKTEEKVEVKEPAKVEVIEAKIEKVVGRFTASLPCETVKQILPIILCGNSLHIRAIAGFYLAQVSCHGRMVFF